MFINFISNWQLISCCGHFFLQFSTYLLPFYECLFALSVASCACLFITILTYGFFPILHNIIFFFSAQNYAFKSYISTYPSPINIQGTASDLSASEWADQFNCYQYFMTLASIALFGGRVWVMAIFCVYKYFIAHLAWWSE